MDAQLVDKIVHEVKSQGVFDEFRKDSMADVDTKPAYQNLRQRVEGSVKKFLAEQKWTPETNKYQLRERLRRHITESGFLDVGVNLVVDQVVNPKIGSVFQPRIEEIAYKYLGVPQPPPYAKCEPPPPPMHPLPPLPPMHPLPPLPLNGPPLQIEMGSVSLLPTDLEQVSPDSDKGTVKSDSKEEGMMPMDMDEKADDDDESPPFEPLDKSASPVAAKKDSADLDNSGGGSTTPSNAEQDFGAPENNMPTSAAVQENDDISQDTTRSTRTAVFDSEKEASRSMEAAGTQESQLSQVSSDSHLSFHDANENDCGSGKRDAGSLETTAACNISEEAQMPKFSDNSSDQRNGDGAGITPQLHFDIKKDEIKFEGTERKSNLMPLEGVTEQCSAEVMVNAGDVERQPLEESRSGSMDDCFKFGKLRVATELAEAQSGERSLVSSHDDSSSRHLVIVEKLKDETETETKTKSPRNDNDEQNSSTPVGTPTVVPPAPERDENSSAKHSSSSSSRHKRHSKDKHRSHERDRNRDKEREREKDKHKSRYRERSKERHRSRSGKHSSSSSKHSSSASASTAQQSADAAAISKSGNGAKSALKHSISSSPSSSSSRTEGGGGSQQSIARRSDSGDKRGSKKGERKSHKDDHNESKEKPTRRRKSTDSNDDDKTAAPPPSGLFSCVPVAVKTSTSKAKHTNGTGGSTNGTMHSSTTKGAALSLEVQQTHRNKVVILNDILQNPATNFIELETHQQPLVVTTATTSSLAAPIEVATTPPPLPRSRPPAPMAPLPRTRPPAPMAPSPPIQPPTPPSMARPPALSPTIDSQAPSLSPVSQSPTRSPSPTMESPAPSPPLMTQSPLPSPKVVSCDDVSQDLEYFNPLSKKQYAAKVGPIDDALKTIRCLRMQFAQHCSSEEQADSSSDSCQARRRPGTANRLQVLEYRADNARDKQNMSPPTKRFKQSPTPSEANSSTSGGSKENETVDKNAGALLSIDKRLSSTNNEKLQQQQCYKSDDLYKPRHAVLGQRYSKRRLAIDSL